MVSQVGVCPVHDCCSAERSLLSNVPAVSVASSIPDMAADSQYIANAAACYTQYYSEMISYFDRLLTAIEQHNFDEEEATASTAGTIEVFVSFLSVVYNLIAILPG